VIHISDGDTMTVLVDQKQIRVRLADIDAPERRQAFGTKSRQSLAAICFRKPAVVHGQSRDRYGRVIGRVICDGVDAQQHQVSSGMAWVFERYAPPSSPLYPIQQEAQTTKHGLWADKTPVPPWEWRSKTRQHP